MSYATLKTVHVAAVVISLLLFTGRGYWMMTGSALLKSRFSRVVPHVVDTILLASAIALMFAVHQYPFVHGWLTAKVLGLILYIALGTVALKRGRTRTIRVAAFLAALLVFAWMVMTARARAPYSPF